jgi:hypothetical protein
MVTLHTTDRNKCIASFRLGIGEEILQLASLVAAIGIRGIQVIALGVDGNMVGGGLGQVGTDAGEGVDWRGAEEEGRPGDGGEGFGESEVGHGIGIGIGIDMYLLDSKSRSKR